MLKFILVLSLYIFTPMATNIFLFILFLLICCVFIYAAVKVGLNLYFAIKERNKKWIINSIIIMLIEIVLFAYLLPSHINSGIALFHKIFG